MKVSKKILSVVLAVLMIAGVFSAVSMSSAASSKTVKTNDSYVKVTSNGYYKITVSKEGYLTVGVKCSGTKSNSSSHVSATLCNGEKKEFAYDESYCYVYTYGKQTRTETLKVAVSKGTYYLKIENLQRENGASVSIKAKFTSVKQPTNYCPAKALELKSGEKTTIYQTQDYAFARWFKIKLTKNKTVTLNFYAGTFIKDLYDSKGNEIEASYVENGIYRTPKLAKGTYYICIDTNNKLFRTNIISFSWK